jgi:anti-anti-sigma factor
VVDLRIDTRNDNGVAVVALSGEFDLAGVERFEAELRRLESESPGVLVVDLTDLQFMDSSGLRALVMADQRARRTQRRLAIVPGPPAVRRVFEITQLDGRLELVESASAV